MLRFFSGSNIEEILDILAQCDNKSRHLSLKKLIGVNFFVNPKSFRYKVFREKGVKCVGCGVCAQKFAVEKFENQLSNKCHINFYAFGDDEQEIMMTVDHIVPLKKGGSNKIENLQPMCRKCNQRKGSK